MFKSFIRSALNGRGIYLHKGPPLRKYRKIYQKYRDYTMLSEVGYYDNLFLTDRFANNTKGDIVECGVWRGGMIAGIAELCGSNRKYYLFDSFEGLPDAKEIDGDAAKKYQADVSSPSYHDNCAAEVSFAKEAMEKSGAEHTIVKGWFSDTLSTFEPPEIALLRLDGDWYDSTLQCLQYLYPFVVPGGLIIIDDYYTWDGCSRAVHDYLSSIKSASRINRSDRGVCYIIKNEQPAPVFA